MEMGGPKFMGEGVLCAWQEAHGADARMLRTSSWSHLAPAEVVNFEVPAHLCRATHFSAGLSDGAADADIGIDAMYLCVVSQ